MRVETRADAARVTIPWRRRDAKPEGVDSTSIELRLSVSAQRIVAAGDNEPWRHSGFRWLDSCIALDGKVVKPYTPVAVDGRRLSVLGRRQSESSTVCLPVLPGRLWTRSLRSIVIRPWERSRFQQDYNAHIMITHT